MSKPKDILRLDLRFIAVAVLGLPMVHCSFTQDLGGTSLGPAPDASLWFDAAADAPALDDGSALDTPDLVDSPDLVPACAEGIFCKLGCTNRFVDAYNCGRCGVVCSPGSACVIGACVHCDSPEIACYGTCANPYTSHENCGGCTSACAPGVTCQNAVCPQCRAGLTKCNTQCVNFLTNPDSCGSCNHACPAGHGCANGLCQ